jgi:hypothetical protein
MLIAMLLASNTLVNSALVNWLPWSVLKISGGTVRISVCGRAVEHQAAMALMKRSPKMTAN